MLWDTLGQMSGLIDGQYRLLVLLVLILFVALLILALVCRRVDLW